MSKKVAIIIPNWNGKNFLIDCLASLKKVRYDNFFVIVVDNGSTDDSIACLKDNFPEVTLIENKDNLGFPVAVNQGIKLSFDKKIDCVLLLNNDTIVAPDFLEEMVNVLDDEKVGIVGAKIYYHDDQKKIWFAGGKFVKWRASGRHIAWMKNDSPGLKGIVEADFITGCTMLISKEVFQDIGYFFEPYFLTVEDLDFCYQANKKKWSIKVNLDAKIFHKVSLSREGEFSFSNGYYGTRNRLFFAFKRTNNCIGGFILLFFVLPARILQRLLLGNLEMAKGTIWGIKDFFLGKMDKY